jgi:hypothetical protein
LRSSFRDAHSPRGPTAPDTAGRPCLDVLADDGPPSLARQGARYRHYLFGSAGRLTSIRWLDARHVGRSSREASTERRAGRFVRWPMPPHKRRVAVPARDQPETACRRWQRTQPRLLRRPGTCFARLFAARSVHRPPAHVNCGAEMVYVQTSRLRASRYWRSSDARNPCSRGASHAGVSDLS